MSQEMKTTVDHTASHPNRRILVTGATGYVGGRVVPELLAAGFTVRTTSRHRDSLKRFQWFSDVEAVEADLTDPHSVAEAVKNVDVLLYLVHSMGAGEEDFEKTEEKTARNIASEAAKAGVQQIVYLSGLHPRDKPLEELSKHMRSRERVARILLESPVPAIILRAATLIGSGSASFEIIRHLTEKLPVMVAPQWINNKIEPLAIRDALYYLVNASDLDEAVNEPLDVGNGEVQTFADLLRGYGSVQGYRRLIGSIPIPLPMDKLSGMWIGLVTPVPSNLAIPLAQSMAEDAVTEDHRIAEFIPDPPGGFTSYKDAVKRALKREKSGDVITSWYQGWKNQPHPEDSYPTDPDWAGGRIYRDVRTENTDLSPEEVWPIIEGIGGSIGWYSAPLLWKIRGLLDKLVGGPGLGGRRDPQRLSIGDRVDWWRVMEIDRPHRLVLRGEFKVDGSAWLTLELQRRSEGGSHYIQRVAYAPQGFQGRLYWWAVYPFHTFIFPVMRRNILKAASQRAKVRN